MGNQAHRLAVLEAANPGDPALCLSLPGCGPNGENNVYTTAAGQLRLTGPAGLWDPILGASATRRLSEIPLTTHSKPACVITAGRLQLFFSYTYSKSLDLGSNLGDQVDPFDPNLLRGFRRST